MDTHYSLPDNELAALLKEGDHAAYVAIYNRYHAALYIHAYKRLQDREECRDIIQELFTSLWLKREQMVFAGNLPGYLYTAVRNRIFDLMARTELKTAYMTDMQQFLIHSPIKTDHLARQNQLKTIIEKEIQLLPLRTRQIFELSRKGHFTHRQIAEQLAISEQTVKTTVNNALKVLRVKLGAMFFLF